MTRSSQNPCSYAKITKCGRGDHQFSYHLVCWQDFRMKRDYSREIVTATNSRVFSFLIVEFLPVNICKPLPSSPFTQFANFFALVYYYCWKPEKSVFTLISSSIVSTILYSTNIMEGYKGQYCDAISVII